DVTASTQQSGRIKHIGSTQHLNGVNQYTYFELEDNGTRSSLPSCANNAKHWIINEKDPDIAKHQISIILMAKAQGRMLYVEGNNACDLTRNGITHPEGGEVVRTLLIY